MPFIINYLPYACAHQRSGDPIVVSYYQLASVSQLLNLISYCISGNFDKGKV